MDRQEAEYYLVKGLMCGYIEGLINFEMVKWVLRSVRRNKKNRKFLEEHGDHQGQPRAEEKENRDSQADH